MADRERIPMDREAVAPPKNKRPAYQRVEEDIRSRVRDGRLPAGTMLASRHNLAREYGVALSTAQQAVANLIADGILEASDRRGTFVTQPESAHRDGGSPVPHGEVHSAMLGDSRFNLSRGQTTATLGIVATARIATTASPDVGSLWAQLAIRSLEHVFSAAGGATRFFDRYPEDRSPSPRRLDDARAVSIPKAITALRAAGAAAIAVVGLCDAADMSDEVVSAVDVESVPTVYLSWHEVQPPLAQVFYDNRFAGYQAAQHLLRQGYRRLIFLAPFADTWLSERVEGARNAVRQAGLPEDFLRLYPSGPLGESYERLVSGRNVYELARAIFADSWDGVCPGGPCGIITPNDDTAYAVLEAAAAGGRTAGGDFGLIGFDDDPRSCVAGLTTIRPPVEAMGEEAGRLLLRALHGDKKGQLVRLRSQLIPRASTSLRLGGGGNVPAKILVDKK